MNPASATQAADASTRTAAQAPRSRSEPVPRRCDEAAMRRRAKRQALLLMAASSLVTIALLVAAWLAFR